jgi:hypothetical protein
MTTTLSRRSSLPLSIALVLAVCSTLDAQQDLARLAGTVRSSLHGRPISDVLIAVGGTRMFDVTDSTGEFVLAGLPVGKQTLRILYRDEVFHEQPIKLRQGKTLQLDVLLDVEAIELAPVVVEARSVRALRSLAGFYERRKRGFGRFYTFEDLERRGSASVGALLAESGVQLRCRMGYCLPVNWIGARSCVMPLYFDGFPLSAEQVDMIWLDDLAGVEVYKHDVSVPWEYRRGVHGSCGSIVMWSRY